MARTDLAAVTGAPNSSIADPAGTAVNAGAGNGHRIPSVQSEELFIRIAATFAGAKNFTVLKGVSPPALEAGQGDLVVAINNATRWIGPLTSARFAQVDGSIHVDVESAATGTITAFVVPRTA